MLEVMCSKFNTVLEYYTRTYCTTILIVVRKRMILSSVLQYPYLCEIDPSTSTSITTELRKALRDKKDREGDVSDTDGKRTLIAEYQ